MNTTGTRFSILLFILLGLAVLCATADELHLRNGEVLHGTITVAEDTIRIILEDGRALLFQSAEVERIVKSGPAEQATVAATAETQLLAEAVRLVGALLKAKPDELAQIGTQLIALGDVAVEPLTEKLVRAAGAPDAERLAHALSRIGTAAAERALVQAALSPQVFIRQAAADKLVSFSSSSSSATLLRLATTDEQNTVRGAALKALALRREWLALPALSTMLETSAVLRPTAVKALTTIQDPAVALFVYPGLRSADREVAAAAWSVFESVAIPVQAGYASRFLLSGSPATAARARQIVERLRKGGVGALISLLDCPDSQIQGKAAVDLLGKSEGQRFGLDREAWFGWARDNLKVRLAVVRFYDAPPAPVSAAAAALVVQEGITLVEERIGANVPAAIPGTSPPERRAEDLLDAAERAASAYDAHLVLGFTAAKIRHADHPMTFTAVRPGRAAVVSLFHFQPAGDDELNRRAAFQALHSLALLLQLPACPDNDVSCPASPVNSVGDLDRIRANWSTACATNLRTGLSVVRARIVGDMAYAAETLVALSKGERVRDVLVEAALNCERGILPEQAIQMWTRYLEHEKDTGVRALIEDRIERLLTIAGLMRKDREAAAQGP